MRTIKASSGRFTCMTTFGHRIAAVCVDGRMGTHHNHRAFYNRVGVYDSVTGALRLSLSPRGPVRALEGSPDGFVLFCADKRRLVTMWDIQTGGLIHTFDLGSLVECIAICSKGRHLACGLSDGSIKILDVANKTDFATYGSGPPVTHLCWLEMGEQLVVARGTSAQVLDVIALTVLRDFTIQGRICGVVYARKLNKFAIASTSETKSTITVIDPRTDTLSTTTIMGQISCLAFSQITTEFVCVTENPGLELYNVPARSWRRFGHPATITSVSMLSSGTVVANAMGSGIQLLSLDEGYTPPQQLTVSPLTVHTFDEGKIIAILPTAHDYIRLFESATMLPLPTIPAWSIPTDHPQILCASLKHHILIRCFLDRDRAHREMWKFDGEAPEWTDVTHMLQLVGGISPSGSRLVAIERNGPFTNIRLYLTKNGACIGELALTEPGPWSARSIEFESENQFYLDHDDKGTRFTISQPGTFRHPYSIRVGETLPSPHIQSRRSYYVDDAREWVIGSSKRICWIPPGYIGSVNHAYGCAGDTLIMSGQDGVLRKITFRRPS